MADSFVDIGLGADVAAAARAAGFDEPTPLQAGAASVLRRGTNVVLHASSGAGVTAAFGLPLLDRIAAGEMGDADPRVLVLAPTQDRAEHVATALAALAGGSGIAVRAVGSGWRTRGSDVLVTTPQRALEGVQTSELKLDGVQSLVIMEAGELFVLGGSAALEALVPLLSREAQRVITSASLDADLERFIEAHARKAFTVPARPAAAPRAADSREPLGQIGYMIVDDSTKPETVARLLEAVSEPAVIYTRSVIRAERVMGELARRGIADGERDVRAVPFAAGPVSAARSISFDVPFSAEQLRALHETGGTILITPLERAHLHRIAGEVPFTLKHRKSRETAAGELDAFRRGVQHALESEDLDAQLLVLEPLLEEYDAAEVAAALSALVRRRAPVAEAAPAPGAGAAPAEASAGGFTRLFVSIGTRDNIRPGDLVGAITGEANIKGDQVGRVDIRDTFSVVEVASSVAERVIRALNGTTMRGRSLRVDFDRKGAGAGGGARERGSRGPGGPRGGDRPRPRAGRTSGPPRRRPPEQ
ncbi:MAG TPA: DbpA RNA binding domain-containing protein [Longimicrobiales bacterium]